MITNISWAAYFYTAALLMVLWYLFIGFRYFYADIKSAFGSRFSGPSKWDAGQTHEAPSQGEPTPHFAAKGAFEENSFNDFDVIEEVVDRVKTLISTTIEKAQPKSDFLLGLHPIFKDYPALKSSQFRPSINEFVTTECEAQGLENVTTEEVENCWNL